MKHLKSIVLLSLIFSCGSVASQEIWSVDGCMQYAIENNSELKKQLLNQADAKSTLTQSKLAFIPTISASTSVGTNFGRSIDPGTNTYISTSNLGNSYELYGEVALFNGLQTVNNFKIAKVSKLREELTTQQIENQIATQTMSAYYRAIFAYGAYKIANGELTDNREMCARERVRYEVGLANISDVAQLESRVSQSEYNITNLEGVYRKSLLELKDKMYLPLDHDLTIDTLSSTPTQIVATRESFEQVYAIALFELPEFKIAENDERIAELNLSTAKAKLFPRFSLGANINTGYSKILDGYDLPQDGFQTQFKNRMGQYLGVSVSIPLWGGLARQKEIQRQRNSYKRVKIERNETSREIEKLIFEALIDLDSFEKQCQQSIANVKANELSHQTTEAKFVEGLATVIDIQTTQTNLSRAKIDQLQAFLNYLMQRRIVDYYKGVPLIR